MIEQVDTFWHETKSRPDLGEDVRVGKLGAMSHLIDKKDRAISDGYHELYLTQEEKNDGFL